VHGVLNGRRPRGRPVRPAAVILLVAGLLGAAVLPGAAASPGPGPSTAALQVIAASTQLWVGDNDLLFDLLGTDDQRLNDPGLAATVRLTSPDGVTGAPLDLKPIQLALGGRTLYRTRVPFDAVGSWTASVDATTSDGTPMTGSTPLSVLDDRGTPALGSAVPPIQTPTLESSGFELASITSDPDPDLDMYFTSVQEALQAGRPFVLVIDTVGLKVNQECGGALGEIKHVSSEFPGLLTIHAEPFVTRLVDGVLVADPPGEPPHPASWSTAWGVTEPPWVFVVGADGRLLAKFSGIFGSDELRSVLRRISAWAPGGH
jgi:hypothetical protein